MKTISRLSITVRIVAVILIAGLGHTLSVGPTGARLELAIQTQWYKLRGPIEPPLDPVLVNIDDQTFQALHATTFFFPRERFADLTERLSRAGARGVVFDIAFKDNWPDPAADKRLGDALGLLPTIIVQHNALDIEKSQKPDPNLPAPAEPPVKVEFEAKVFEVAHPMNMLPFGYATTFSKSMKGDNGRDYRPMYAAAARLMGVSHAPQAGDQILYYGPPGQIRSISMHRVLGMDDATLVENFSGRLAIVGYTRDDDSVVGARDKSPTPTALQMPGVEIQATAIANVLSNTWLRRPPSLFTDYLHILALMLITLVIISIQPIFGLGVVILTGACWFGGAYLAFRQGFLIPGGLAVIGVFPLVWVANTCVDYWRAGLQKRKIEQVFGYYLPPYQVEELMKDPTQVSAPRTAEVTFLFTDLRDYSTMMQNLPLEEVQKTVDTYYDMLSQAVADEKGLVVDLVGDAMLAVFGLPLPIENPNLHALRAAERCIQVSTELRDKTGNQRFVTRFGIHRGTTLAGTFGTKQKRKYTVLSDDTNVAARIEQLGKDLGMFVLISHTVLPGIEGEAGLLDLGMFPTKGRDENVHLYTKLSREIDPGMLTLWKEALGKYQNLDTRTQSRVLFERIKNECASLATAANYYLNRPK
jgi:class 3 adenylate cyclase/CHASE2 domain-containing sensor protein